MLRGELPDSKKVDRIPYDGDNASVKRLQKFLIQANREIVRKEEQLQKLTTVGAKGTVVKVKDEHGHVGNCSKDEDKNALVDVDKKDGDDTGVDALLVFPEEIWEMILKEVDTMSLRSCSVTCKLFAKILHPFRQTWMFKQVIPHLYKYVRGRQILACRATCKSWNDGVDSFLENHRSLRPHNDSQSDPRKPPFVTPMREKELGGYYVFSNTRIEHIISLVEQIFERMMGNHPRNPFIGRAVTITEYQGGEIPERQYWDILYKFLRKFGKHIWYLTVFRFQPCSNTWGKEQLYKLLTTDIFQFCPQLRRLRIAGYVDDYSGESNIQISTPSFSKLESLIIDNAYYEEPSPILTVLTKRYHTNLGRFHVLAKTWRLIYRLGWPNLTELHVEELETMEEFDSLLQMDLPKLKKLGLSLSSNMHDWTFSKMLEAINKISTTSPVHTLRFAGGIPVEFMDKLDSNLYVTSTLKTLEMEHFASIWPSQKLSCYTFLLRFPLLENLHLFWRKVPDENHTEMFCRSEIALRHELLCDYRIYYRSLTDGPEVVEVNKFIYGDLHKEFVSVYDSNRWELLPRLKVLTFQWKTYTREGYEVHCSSKNKFKQNTENRTRPADDGDWFNPFFNRYIRN